MPRLRRAVGRIALTWLLCQVSALILTPTALLFGASEQLLECTCTHGDHAICPMHHKPAPGSKLCLMGSADDDTAAAISFLSGVGLGPAPVPVAAPPPSALLVAAADTTAQSLRPAPPDPPPPRL